MPFEEFENAAPEWDSDQSDQELSRTHYVDVGESQLLKKMDLPLDPKYKAIAATRKDMAFEDSEDEFAPMIEMDSSESESESEQSSGGDQNSSPTHEEEETTMSKLKIQANEDMEKGLHVKNQMAIWDGLLEFRIRTQKLIEAANQFPVGEDYDQVVQDSELQNAIQGVSLELCTLFDELVEFKLSLVSEAQLTCKNDSLKRKRMSNINEWIESSWEDVLNPLESGLLAYRNETIEKWSAKVNQKYGNSAETKFKVLNKSIVEQIESSMESEKLFKRTKLNRSESKGSKDTGDQYNDEIFDDTDYYQQLLKEFIEGRMSDTNDPTLISLRVNQLKELQRKRSKKNVDTKASKGRKIRYHVHEKIQNYMAPEPRGDWHTEMAEELFASLLGNQVSAQKTEVPEDGFKIL